MEGRHYSSLDRKCHLAVCAVLVIPDREEQQLAIVRGTK